MTEVSDKHLAEAQRWQEAVKEVRFHDVVLDRHDGSSVVWQDISGELPLPSPQGGSRLAAMLVEVGVDGTITVVSGQSLSRLAIEQAIIDLQLLVDWFDAVLPTDQSRGRCLEYGSWGQCRRFDVHDNHDFPSEEDYRAGRC